MAFFRQYIAPLIILLGFVFALVAVSARSFLPGDMLEPATPIGQIMSPDQALENAPENKPETLSNLAPNLSQAPSATLPPQLSQLVYGDAPAL